MPRVAQTLQGTADVVAAHGVEPATSARLERSGRCLIEVAVWFALVSGLCEVGILAIEKYYFYPMMRLSRDFIWMAPLALTMLLLLTGLAFLLVGRFVRRIDPFPPLVFICSLLAIANLLMLVPRLHHFAVLLIAAGLAVQVSRFIAARVVSFRALVRRTLFWMIGAVVVAGFSLRGGQMLAERQALAQLPPAHADAPNVLFITLDTVRAQNLSLYGYHRSTTPQLERIATFGVVFDRALSVSSWTLPSHASMFTGHYPHELSTDYTTPLDAHHPTLAEVFRARGYVTAGFVANLGYCSYETGLNRGFMHYEDYPLALGQVMASSTLIRTMADNFRLRRRIQNDEHLNRKTAAQVNDAVLSWLAREKTKPFFIFLNYFDAHEPYLPPPPFDRKFGPGRKQGKYSPLHHHNWEPAVAHRPLSQEQVREEIDAYDGAIAYLDHHLASLFDELNSRGVFENTLIIITSDHGEEFGEHGIFDHGYTLYLPSLHVPLLILFPSRVPAGIRVREPVSLRDLPATVVDLLEWEDAVRFPGKSLAQYWQGATRPDGFEGQALLSEVSQVTNRPEWFPVSKGDMKSLVMDRYHYVKNGDLSEELYDIEIDPWEKRNLASIGENDRTLGKFRAHFQTIFMHKPFTD